MATLNLPENYGNVIAISVGAIPFLSFLHGVFVNKTRDKAKIPYPHAYATQEQCKADPNAEIFNCAQRAHHNYLENSPQTALSILVAGLRYPNAAALLGTSWIVLRALYMYGYIYRNKPNGGGRYIGLPYLIPQGVLWGMSIFGVGWPLMGSIWGQ